MSFSIQNNLQFTSTSLSCHKPCFSRPTEITRWALCDLAASSSLQAIRFYGIRYERFLLDGFTHFFPEMSGNVDWSPSLGLITSSFSSWVTSRGQSSIDFSLGKIVSAGTDFLLFASTSIINFSSHRIAALFGPKLNSSVYWTPSKSVCPSSLRAWMANGNFATGAFTLVGLILAVIGFVLTSVTTAFSALQIAGLSLMTLSVLLTCGASLLKVCSIAAKIFKADRNIRWLSQQVKDQSLFLKSNYTSSESVELGGDCEAAVRTLSNLFSLSANRETLLGYKYYRALLIQALVEQIISLLLVTSIVLLFIFAGVFGITALPTVVMGGMAILFGICVMAASVRTMLALIGEKGHRCKHHIQKAWENAACSEELMQAPEDLLSEHFSILSDCGKQPAYLSLCMRLLKGGSLLNLNELCLLQSSLSSLDHLLIDARNEDADKDVSAKWMGALYEMYTTVQEHNECSLNNKVLAKRRKDFLGHRPSSDVTGRMAEAHLSRGSVSSMNKELMNSESVGSSDTKNLYNSTTAALGATLTLVNNTLGRMSSDDSMRVPASENIFNTMRSSQTAITDDESSETTTDDDHSDTDSDKESEQQSSCDSEQENNKEE